MKYKYKTSGTCSREIYFELEGNIVKNISFYGGCDGNLQGISKLAEGLTAGEVIEKCGGIRCGGKPTSCPDQLARAIKAALDEEEKRASE